MHTEYVSGKGGRTVASTQVGRLGRRLAEARARAHLSQSEVAASLGVAQSALAKMEAGRRLVSFLEALDLARLYEIEPIELDPRTEIVESDPAPG